LNASHRNIMLLYLTRATHELTNISCSLSRLEKQVFIIFIVRKKTNAVN